MPKIKPALTVYIPTRGRVGINKQVTLREFRQYSTFVPVLVCPPGEYKEHKKYHNLVMACVAQGIGPTRQWIIENSRSEVAVMMDDDMRFSYRPDPTKPQLEKLTNLDPMLYLILNTVRNFGFVHGGIGARQGNNRKDLSTKRSGVIEGGHLVQDCERVNNIHFLNPQVIRDLGIRMDELEVMEDFHFTLSLLLRGFPNRVIHDYVWNQEGSGNSGGCSLYRTAEVQEKAALELKERFPEYVSVVKKKTTSVWKDFSERTDVRIQWLKAARAGGIQI